MKKMIVNTALLIALSTLLSGCEMQMQHRVEEWYKEGVSKKTPTQNSLNAPTM